MKTKIKVAVLMGGKSPEYEISLISGKEVIRNLDKKKYLPIPVVIPKSGKGIEKILQTKADIVFIAMHGPYGEDGRVQGMLDMAGIKYTGSGITASAVGMDKFIFRKLMQFEGIPIPRLTKQFPCFVKPTDQGSSVGASFVKDPEDLPVAIKLAKKYSPRVIIEEYLKGKEVTCAVLGNEKPKALPVIEIVPLKNKFFDYQSKYSKGGAQEIVPARISKELTRKIQKMAVKVYQTVGCRGFGRVDFILKDNRKPVVLEINTIPGLTPMSLVPKAARAVGISYSRLLDKIIRYAL
jgi:D-alanine-D-alanine ligase